MAKSTSAPTRKDLLKALREKVLEMETSLKNRLLRKKGTDVHQATKLRKDIARIKTQLRTLTK